MIGRWQAHNNDIFVRDLLRDFCTVYAKITEQNTRFAHSGTISYAVLRELLGEAMRKGIFWRLKDTAHHLFRKKNRGRRDFEGYDASIQYSHERLDNKPTCQQAQNPSAVLENILDWCIGYTFHECIKLKEDAFQRQHYSNRLIQIQNRAQEHTHLIENLMPYTMQTRESIGREIVRILDVLNYARQLIVLYVHKHGDNGSVARFIAEHEELVKETFQEHWEELLQSLYGKNTFSMYVLAAKACFEGGHRQEALLFEEKAQEHGADAASLAQLTEYASSEKFKQVL